MKKNRVLPTVSFWRNLAKSLHKNCWLSIPASCVTVIVGIVILVAFYYDFIKFLVWFQSKILLWINVPSAYASYFSYLQDYK